MRYGHGDALLVAAPDALLLLDHGTPAVLEAVHGVLRSTDGGLGGLLGILLPSVGGDLSALPPFALVLRRPGSLTVFVRGNVVVRVAVKGEPARELTGAGLSTWAEAAFGEASRVEVVASGQGVGDVAWPLVDGVVRAGFVVWGLLEEPAFAAEMPTVRAASPELVVPASVIEPDHEATAEWEGLDSETPEAPVPEAPAPATLVTEALAVGRSAAPARPVVPRRGPLPPVPAHWLQSSRALTRRAPGAPLRLADSDATVTRTAEMLAVRCSQGHVTPANGSRCRVCDQPLEALKPFVVLDPVLGRLRVDGLEQDVPLGRSVIIGRDPDQGAASSSAPVQLVRVANRHKVVSRSHCEVQVLGWQVSVLDLGTENGTVITLPTGENRQLRPRTPVQIEPGTVITMSERVEMRYVVP